MTDGPPAPTIEAYLDDLTPDRVRGWAWLPDAPHESAVVEIVDADGLVVRSTPADRFRGDLESAGKRGGRCGFEMAIPREDSPRHFVRVRSRDSSETRVLGDVEGAARPANADAWRRIGVPGQALGWIDRADAGGISGWCY